MDILIKKHTIIFRPLKYSDVMISLSECYDFEVKTDGIYCDIRKTSKKALYYFILNSVPFRIRKDLFVQSKALYASYIRYFDRTAKSKVPYYEKLYAHQKECLFFSFNKKYTLLALEQGLGKTITAASISRLFGFTRTIVVSPSLVKWNWYHDMTDVWGFNPIYWSILDANERKTVKAFQERFVVVNYESVKKYFSHLTREPVQHIILDEIHLCKNPNSARSKKVQELINAHHNARVTMMSGTPVTNRVNDMFAYLKMAQHPLGQNKAAFLRQYTVQQQAGRGKGNVLAGKNLHDLRVKLANFMVRKRTEECIDLPDLVINKYYFKHEDFIDEYNQALEELYKTKMKYKDDDHRGAIARRGNIHTMNRIISRAKVKNIINLVDKLNDVGRKVIVFAGYKDCLHDLRDHYKSKCVLIDGSVNAYDRQTLIDRFKQEEKVTVFLGNMKAAGVGINLVNSRDVIFCNFPFTPEGLEQAYKRAHRIGQKNKVNVYYTICEETIDTHIYNLLIDKSGDINEVMDKGKAGVVDYEKVPGMLFNKLIEDYERQIRHEKVS